MSTKKIGSISSKVVTALSLDKKLIGSDILIGDTNIQHMRNKHNADYIKYGNKISTIINSPDYVGINSKDQSIEYVKEFVQDGEFVKVAVRISTNGNYYVRSLYLLNTKRVNNFIAKKFLKPIDNT
ncbi:MAG: transposase [Ruminococcus sp.]|uniref:PBECR3 domain-containing polyvalent protein n=1 Tax=Ruminococcus sp. TaxID=41978 RepID=UPI0025EAF96F|nr:PBECR2 nuclease fold domain-containing protein [Ruminococcus sp.]MCR5539669.1 transposase [Ruminococcus sp.]